MTSTELLAYLVCNNTLNKAKKLEGNTASSNNILHALKQLNNGSAEEEKDNETPYITYRKANEIFTQFNVDKEEVIVKNIHDKIRNPRRPKYWPGWAHYNDYRSPVISVNNKRAFLESEAKKLILGLKAASVIISKNENKIPCLYNTTECNAMGFQFNIIRSFFNIGVIGSDKLITNAIRITLETNPPPSGSLLKKERIDELSTSFVNYKALGIVLDLLSTPIYSTKRFNIHVVPYIVCIFYILLVRYPEKFSLNNDIDFLSTMLYNVAKKFNSKVSPLKANLIFVSSKLPHIHPLLTELPVVNESKFITCIAEAKGKRISTNKEFIDYDSIFLNNELCGLRLLKELSSFNVVKRETL